jgi:hypothetical protein
MTVMCQHCRKKPARRPRGLCWACFDNRAIRARFPLEDERYGRHGLGVRDRPSRPPAQPTEALPASEQKIRAMEVRAKNGEGLFHREDGRADL